MRNTPRHGLLPLATLGMITAAPGDRRRRDRSWDGPLDAALAVALALILFLFLSA